MSELKFDDFGYLPPVVHQLSSHDFTTLFCDPADLLHTSESKTSRRAFGAAFQQLQVWAKDAGATSIVVGGSFITDKPAPSDMDVLVVFSCSRDIKSPASAPSTRGASIDIQCISEDEPELLQAFLQLIGADRRYIGRGLIQVKLHPSIKSLEMSSDRSPMMSAAWLSYTQRKHTTRSDSSRLVIPIHGIRSDAAWVPKFTLHASTAGWGVAPFIYGFESGLILGDENRKAAVVNEFRLWLNEIRSTYKGTISIVAHSFGSYIVGRYLKDAGALAEQFGGIVLTGSILSPDYDWRSILNKEVVTMVLNTRSANDQWVKILPDGGLPFLAKDALMGKAAVDGFKNSHPRLIERQSNLLNHNNMFELDVMLKIWLPFLAQAEQLIPFDWDVDENFLRID